MDVEDDPTSDDNQLLTIYMTNAKYNTDSIDTNAGCWANILDRQGE